MKIYESTEKILKRFLKKKKSMSASLVVTFLITGQVLLHEPVFARDLRARVREANNVVPDKQGPGMNTSANKTDVVNIVNPDSNGISHNKFIDLSVGSGNGLIFNNSTKDGVSQIGGYVTKNSNLKESASVILNEVTGNKISNINGDVEVFGKRADFILANENGINVNGGTFINTSGVTLSTGAVNRDNSGNINYNVQKGNINLNGVGTSGDYFNVLAQTVQIHKEISPLKDEQTPDITIIAGKNKISSSSQNQKDVKILSSEKSISDKYGIYADKLGAMYGNNIRLISTDQGLGVKHEGFILSKEDIKIESNGDIALATVNSEGKLDIKGKKLETLAGKIKVNDKEYANNITSKKDININLTDDSTLNSTLQSTDGKVAITGKNLTLKKDSDGKIVSTKDISIDLTGALNNSNTITGSQVTVTSDSLENSGTISGTTDLNIDTKGDINNSGNLLANKNIKINAKNFISKNTNTGTSNKDLAIIKGNSVDISTTENLENGSALLGKEDVKLTAGNSLKNSGELNVDGNVNLAGKNIESNKITAGKKVAISAGDKFESGTLIAGEDIAVKASNLNVKKELTTNKNLNVQGDFSIENGAKVSVKEDFKSSSFDNKGNFVTGGNFETNGKNFSNSGKLGVSKDANITSENFSNTGNLLVEQKLNATGKNIDNTGKIQVKDGISLKASENLNNNGMIASAKNIDLSGNTINNGEGDTIWAEGDVSLTANKEINNGLKANIISKSNINLTSPTINNNAGNIVSGDKLNIKTDTLNNKSNTENTTLIDGYKEIETVTRWDDTFNYHLDYVKLSIPNIVNKSVVKDKATIQAGGDINITGYSSDKAKLVNESGDISTAKDLNIKGDLINKTNYQEVSVDWLLDHIQVSLHWETKLYLSNAHGNGGVTFTGSLKDALKKGYFSGHNAYYKSLIKQDNPMVAEVLAHVLGANWKAYNKPISQDRWNFDGSFKYYAANGEAKIFTGGNINHSNGVFSNDGGKTEEHKNITVNIGNGSVEGVTSDLGININDFNSIKEINGIKQIHDVEIITGEVTINGITIKAEKGNNAGNTGVSGTINPIIFIEIPSGENSLFKPAKPSQSYIQPLYETNIDFIDPNKFYGSQYFFDQIGYDKNKTSTVIGDAYYEYVLLSKMIKAGVGYQSSLNTNDIKAMLDNAVFLRENLGLEVGKPLTPSQINRLNKDIIWYVEVEVNGQKVLTPQIYFSNKSRLEIAKNQGFGGTSEIKVGGNLNSDSTNFDNLNGNIKVNGDVNIKSSGDVNIDSSSGVKSGITTNSGNVDISSDKNIDISGGTVKGNNVHVAGEEVNISSNTGIDGEKGQTISDTGSIIANKNIDIESKKDTSITGGKISSTNGNINIKAQEDLIIKDINTVSSSAKHEYGHYNNTDEVSASSKSNGTEIKGNNISLNGHNIDITGSSITTNDTQNTNTTSASNSKIDINAVNDVNIKAGKELDYSSKYHKDFSFVKGLASVTTSQKTSSSSLAKGSLVATNGDLNINSYNTNLVGSALGSLGNTTINAKNDINITDARDEIQESEDESTYQVLGGGTSWIDKKSSTSKGSSITSGKGINLVSGNNIKVVNGDINAKNTTSLNAKNDISIEAGKNEYSEKAHSAAMGVFVHAEASVAGKKVAKTVTAYEVPKSIAVNKAKVQTYPAASGLPQIDGIGSVETGLKFEYFDSSINNTNWSESSISGNNIVLNSGNTLDIGGGDYKANENIDISAKNLETTKYEDTSNTKATGFSLYLKESFGAESSIVDTANRIANSIRDGEQTDPGILAAQGIGTATNLIFNNLGGAGFQTTLGYDVSVENSSSSKENITDLKAKNIKINTSGDTKLAGVNMEAQNDVDISSGGNIEITSAKSSSNKNVYNSSGDVRFGQGAGGNLIFGAGVGMNVGGTARVDINKEDSSISSNSNIKGNNIKISSNKDLNILGGNVEAKNDVDLKVNGDVNIESQKSTTNKETIFASVAGRLGLGVASNTIVKGDFIGGVGAGYTKAHNETIEISGIKAGNSVNADINGDLTLKGGVLGSDSKKGSVNVGGDINLATEKNNSYSKGGDAVVSLGQSGDTGVSANIADILDKKESTKSAIGVDNITNGGKTTVNGVVVTNKEIDKDINSTHTVDHNYFSKGGSLTVSVPVGSVKNKVNAHKSGEYDLDKARQENGF